MLRPVTLLQSGSEGADLSNNGWGMLDTNLGATPSRSLVNDGNAHFQNFVFNLKVKTIRSSGVARVGMLMG